MSQTSPDPLKEGRLALGTAQFGMAYGIVNRNGRVDYEEVDAILRMAEDAGMDTLDTAMAYGSSEETLGAQGVARWKVVTKLSGIPKDCENIESWVGKAVNDSIKRLSISKLHGLLLHRPQELLGARGGKLFCALQKMKAKGLVEKIGVSVYAPEELEELFGRFALDLVQAPFNVLDRRLIVSGWLERLNASGVEVHARSIFLQGLLLTKSNSLPRKFSKWRSIWEIWNQWLDEEKITPLGACLDFALRQQGIERVIVGVCSQRELSDIISSTQTKVPTIPDSIICEEEDLINPSKWN